MQTHFYVHVAWVWVVRAFWTIGGFAGVTRILEWLFKGPKIVGYIEQRVSADEVKPTGELFQSNLLLQVYLVNKRIQPVNVRDFIVSVKLASGEWRTGNNCTIPSDFALAKMAKENKFPVDFSAARLYDKVGIDVLEYGKGVRGWLRVVFPDLRCAEILKSDIKIQVVDAFDKKHMIKEKYGSRAFRKASYHPGAGIDQG